MVFMAAAAMTLASCAKEGISEQNKGGQKFAEVSFKAEIPSYQTTKSTIDVDGLTFNTRWADGDRMGLMCEYGTDETNEVYNLCGTYSKGVFSAKFPVCIGMWFYYGYYPYQESNKADHSVDIPFGAERVQNGNEFNSAYDIMCAEPVCVDEAEQGKTDLGEDITFKMVRQTALLYFHFTTDGLDEPLTNATLTVEGDPIAADKYTMYYYGKNLDSDSHGTSWTSGTSQSISLAFTNAPSSKDFKLWFNVLPYEEGTRENGIKDMKLVVETETKTLTLNATAEEMYLPGAVSKVEFTNVPASQWKDKTTPTPPPATKVFYEKVTTAPTDWSGDYLIVYEDGSVAFDGSLTTLDAPNNGKAVTISADKKIESTDETDAISFFIEAVEGGYSIQSASGIYIDGNYDDKGAVTNGIKESATNKAVNTISLTGEIKGSKNQSLKYNKNVDQKRFRYYTNGQQAIALYKRSKNIDNRPSLIVTTPQSLSLTAQGGTTEAFTVTTNQESWDAVSDNKDFIVNKTENGFTVSASVNPSLSDRKATITVSAGSAKLQTFSIIQSAATFKFYQVGSEEVVLKADKGDTKQITIVSDHDWEAEVPAGAKFSVEPSSFVYADGTAASSGTAKRQAVVFKALETNASEEGTLTLGKVTFTNKVNNDKLYVTVKQETSYIPPVITLSPESLNVAAAATSASFDVQSNVEWTVSTDATWITEYDQNGKENGKVTIIFSANSESTARTAEFTVASADGKLTKKFTLTQKAAGAAIENTVTYDFTKIDGFATWGTGYKTYAVQYTESTITFTQANKQSTNITDCPVTKGEDVSVVMNGTKTIKSVRFVCKQWAQKTQTITLHTSTDGGKNYTSTTTKSSNFTLSATGLADGVNAVKFTFSSKSNQVGISSLEITYVE